MKSFDEMPPGQTPGTITQEFHLMAHQLAEKLRKLHPFLFPRPQRMGPRRPNPQHQNLTSVDLPEEVQDCACNDCLKFIAFAEDPTARSLHQITKRVFRHTCTITLVENSGVENYSVSLRKSKAQLAMDTQKGEGSQDKTEKPSASTAKTTAPVPRYTPITPITKAAVPEMNASTPKFTALASWPKAIAPITKASAPKTKASTSIKKKRVTKFY
ncbi:hypothetical protein VE02_04456 [Pseudogymnoascus sp. 03VT05]|nr:hypothetical protein VE02_04456 [Pseudogymnoascus sp. 03VT05]